MTHERGDITQHRGASLRTDLQTWMLGHPRFGRYRPHTPKPAWPSSPPTLGRHTSRRLATLPWPTLQRLRSGAHNTSKSSTLQAERSSSREKLPSTLCTFPDFCCHSMACLGSLGASHCVDDILVADRASTIFSGFHLWRRFADLAGWDVPDKKSPPPAVAGRILGAWCDLSQTPQAAPTLSITPDRAELLGQMLKEVMRKDVLMPSLAGKLWGKLNFACTQLFGRFGRAKLRPFSRRQHDRAHTRLNIQLKAAIRWWIEELPRLPARSVLTNTANMKRVISFSDGEGVGAQVGIVVWIQGEQRGRGGVIRVPNSVRRLWNARRSLEHHNDIFEIEAVGPLLVLHNFARVVRGALWLHFIDNAGALSSLVNGSSSVMSGDAVVGLTWSYVAAVGCFPWFDRVDSKSNPVDGLSRGRLEGPWDLQQIHFPGELAGLLS